MNSFIPWVGGKSKLLWIINKMAPDHYSRFIDVFGGSGTVTMSRPIQPGCMEVYNDFNSNLTNLFCWSVLPAEMSAVPQISSNWFGTASAAALNHSVVSPAISAASST